MGEGAHCQARKGRLEEDAKSSSRSPSERHVFSL